MNWLFIFKALAAAYLILGVMHCVLLRVRHGPSPKRIFYVANVLAWPYVIYMIQTRWNRQRN